MGGIKTTLKPVNARNVTRNLADDHENAVALPGEGFCQPERGGGWDPGTVNSAESMHVVILVSAP